jgi:hypothetical protein
LKSNGSIFSGRARRETAKISYTHVIARDQKNTVRIHF